MLTALAVQDAYSNQDPSHRQPGEAVALAIRGEHQPTFSRLCLLLQPIAHYCLNIKINMIASDFRTSNCV